jgi:hypothetical protein
MTVEPEKSETDGNQKQKRILLTTFVLAVSITILAIVLISIFLA